MDLLDAYNEDGESSDSSPAPEDGAGSADSDAPARRDAEPTAAGAVGSESAASAGISSDVLERLRRAASPPGSGVASAPSDQSSPAHGHAGEHEGLGAAHPDDSGPLVADGVDLPPPPPGRVDEAVQAGVDRMLAARTAGADLNRDLQDKKEFHNPGILERLVSDFKIVEHGTNYSTACFSADYPRELYYDYLARQAERRDALNRATRVSIGFESGGVQAPMIQNVGGIAQQSAVNAAAAAAAALAKSNGLPAGAQQAARSATAGVGAEGGPVKKKSKWENATSATSVGLPSGMQQRPQVATGVPNPHQLLLMQQQLLLQQQMPPKR
jgi:hypothetical protein